MALSPCTGLTEEEKSPGLAWRALAPWCLKGLCGSAGQKVGGWSPPTVSSLLLSNTIMRGSCPQLSYLQKINGRGRSLVCLWRFAVVLLDGVRVTSAKTQPCCPHLDLIRSGLGATSRKLTAGQDKSAKISRLAGSSPAVVASKENKLSQGQSDTVLGYTVITTPGTASATAERSLSHLTPKLPAFSGFSCCLKYRTALADSSAPQI